MAEAVVEVGVVAGAAAPVALEGAGAGAVALLVAETPPPLLEVAVPAPAPAAAGVVGAAWLGFLSPLPAVVWVLLRFFFLDLV